MKPAPPNENPSICQELLRIDKKALQAYKGAIRTLQDLTNPERFVQSAHSLREVTSLISRKVSLPQEMVESQKYLRKKIEKKFVEKVDLLPSPSEEDVKALIKKWTSLHKYFVKVSHHGGVDELEFFKRLLEFEAILLQFLKPTPVTMEELDSLLKIKSPTEDHIEVLSELLKHPTHVEYFFSRLASLNWLVPLKKRGFFANPPGGIKFENYVMFPAWSLSKYLIKIASQRPKEVMQLMRNLAKTKNFRIHIDLIDCALKMPSSTAKEIIPFTHSWVAIPYTAITSEKIADLCVKLGNENEMDAALELYEVILDVRGPDKKGELALQEAYPYHDLWMYEQILKKVSPLVLSKSPCKVIELLCRVLSKAISLERSDERKSSYEDLSFIWRPAIEDHPQNRDRSNAKGLLVNTIRECLESISTIEKKKFLACFESLAKFPPSIFRRMELYLMNRFPELLKDKIHAILLKKEVFTDVNLWHEYYHLLQTSYANFPDDVKERVLNWISKGPDLEELEAWYEKSKNRKPSHEEKDSYMARWQTNYLSAIREALPPEWMEKWKELVSKYGAPEHPDFHSYISSVWVGPTSPLTKEEIANKTPQETVAYLRTWKPSKDFSAPSEEGLAREFGKAISDNPSNYIKICQEFETLKPVYIYHVIGGFKEAAKKNKTFDWHPVISLCKYLLTMPQLAKTTEDKYYDWNSVKREIADLLEKGLENRDMGLPFELRKITWEMIISLLQHNEPDLSFEQKWGGDNMDPVTLSLNTVRGRAMHLVFRYGLWCARHLNLSTKEERMVPEVKEQLEKSLIPQCEPTLTIRAVFGLYLPNLFYLDGKWTVEHMGKIFPSDAKYRSLSRVAWEAYVTYCPFYKKVYEKMRDQYKNAIYKLESPKISQEAKFKLSGHIIRAYLDESEQLKNDSLISLFFEKAQPEVRGHAIWFIGKVLERVRKSEIEKKSRDRIVKRCMTLWEQRIEEAQKADSQGKKQYAQELKWFGFWFIQGRFEKAWAISQLNRTLEFTKGSIEFPNKIIEELHFYVKNFCPNVLETLVMIAEQDTQRWILVLSIKKIKELLQSITMEHPEQMIKEALNELVEVLTRKGYHEFVKYFIK